MMGSNPCIFLSFSGFFCQLKRSWFFYLFSFLLFFIENINLLCHIFSSLILFIFFSFFPSTRWCRCLNFSFSFRSACLVFMFFFFGSVYLLLYLVWLRKWTEE